MLGRPLIRIDAVSSTMSVLADLAGRGAGEGTTVVAGYQTAGRGRANRTWQAPPDSALLASVLLRPDLPHQRLSAISILVADAIVSSVHALYGLEAQIKWPNDVLIEGRKLSGILLQTRMHAGGPAVVVGFGINANVPSHDLPPHGTSLLVQLNNPVERDGLLVRVLDELELRYRELLSNKLEHRWRGIQERLALRGEVVTVQEGETTITGVLTRVGRDGALVLESGDGEQRVVVGDLTRGPKASRTAGN